MRCPNCGSDYVERNICSQCGADAALYRRTIELSNIFYNAGLKYAQMRDFTAAIHYLRRSVETNKLNHDAQNLLGLVYYESGMLGDALRHWILSANYYKNDDNVAHTHISTLQSGSRQLEKLGESIHLYNRALDDLAASNDDMAVIKLKRAIESNPKFIEAHNLLALCHISRNEDEKALKLVEKSLELDAGNLKALMYYKELTTGKGKVIRKETVERTKSKRATVSKRNPVNTFHLPEIFCFIIGAACAFALYAMLVMPDKVNSKNEEIEALKLTITQQEQKNEEAIKSMEDEVKAVEAQLQNIENVNAELTEEIQGQERLNRIFLAQTYVLDERNEDAAQMIENIDIANLPSAAARVYNSIKDVTYPELEKSYYTEALDLFNQKKYDDAKKSFEKSIEFTTDSSEYVDDSYYFLGRIAQIQGDDKLARTFYEIVINDYPESNQLKNATTRYNSVRDA